MTPLSDLMDTIEHEPGVCEDCRTPFQAAIARSPFDPSKIIMRQRRCEACVTAFEVRIAEEERNALLEAAKAQGEAVWEQVCPRMYRLTTEGGLTELEKLKASVTQFDEVLAHPLSYRGLILRGNTGAGKTRTMFRLLRTYHEQKPRPRIVSMSAGEFDRAARDAAGSFTLTKWFDSMATADVLFIDDIGKGRWTASTAGQFWEVVDARSKAARPIFLTTNCSGETLVQSIGLDKDIAEPLLRRLRENCKAIILTQHKTT